MEAKVPTPRTLISGGQTGVDRAALDWAIEKDVSHAGWCPAGRIAADGVLDKCYKLTETESSGYRQRTKRNIQDSDATLIIYQRSLEGGSQLTHKLTEKLHKPYFLLDVDAASYEAGLAQCRAWLARHKPTRLNFAGPSEARCPGIYQHTLEVLDDLFLSQSRSGLSSIATDQAQSSHSARTKADSHEDH